MKNTFRRALIITTPVFLGYMAIGIAFGLMLVNAGYPWWLAPIMSVVMYAGAGQYVAVSLFAAQAGMVEIAIITLLVNARHLVYGLSLIDKLSVGVFGKLYVVFALTDETYGLFTTLDDDEPSNLKYLYFFIALLNHIYWIVGGVIGAVIGSFITFKLVGLEFALTSLFIVLLLDQIKKCKSFIPFVIAVAAGLIGLFIGGKSNMLIISIAISLALVSIFRNRIESVKT